MMKHTTEPKMTTKLYGIAVYYGGGYQSFGNQLKFSVLYAGEFDLDLSAADADEQLANIGEAFDGYASDLIPQLRNNPDDVAIAHECSDSAYAVGADKQAVLKALAEEILFQDGNRAEFISSDPSTGDDLNFTDSEDGDEENV